MWLEKTNLLVKLVDIHRGLVLGLDENWVLLNLSSHFSCLGVRDRERGLRCVVKVATALNLGYIPVNGDT
jgi:hypothetical protein